MRCHAKYGPFRCELEMIEHLDDRHTFTVEWDDDGGPIGNTGEVDMIGYVENARPMLHQQVAADEPMLAAPDVQKQERGYHLSEQGGIRFDEEVAVTCGICNHPWHQGECPRSIQSGEYVAPCGCMTAAL